MKRLFAIWHELMHLTGWMVAGAALIGFVVAVAYELAYSGMVLPKTLVANIDISNSSREQALGKLSAGFLSDPTKVEVIYRDKKIDTVDLNFGVDLDWAVSQAWSVGRNGNILTRLSERIEVFFTPRQIDVPVKYDPDELEGLVASITTEVKEESQSPQVIYEKESNSIRLIPGKDGLLVDEENLKQRIVLALGRPGLQKIEVPTKVDSQAVDIERVNSVMATANSWKGKTLRLRYKEYFTDLDTGEILGLLSLQNETFNEKEIEDLLSQIKTAIETEPRDAVFNFEKGRVIEFLPEKDGVAVDTAKFLDKLAFTLMEVKSDYEIPVMVTKPKITAGEINNLGIKTLIGVGTSLFRGSIPNRIHNLTLASKKLNGVLVAPGETFSFNRAVGEVSKATGYREAYVISEGRTVLGDGGGVCQVSTTFFRTVMNAGLPILERKAHAYRVHYYEDDLGPGFDATVYSPSADLKFANDTPGYILIQTKVDPKTLSMRFEFYGTDDGRKAEISKAKIFGQSPPLPTIYQDDPTLELGQLKQVDWSAWGAKVSFDYRVTRNGEVLTEKTFYSNYQPWAAIYLRGTGELASR